MTDDYSFIKDYPLDYLIANKDKGSNFYIFLTNLCNDLLTENPDDSQLRLAWNSFKLLLVIAAYFPVKLFEKIYNSFVKTFNHSEQSSYEFTLWIFSDMINETQDFDWKDVPKIPIKLPPPMKEQPPKRRDKDVELFFNNYVNQGGGRIPQPSKEDMRAFAKVILRLIKEPMAKDRLKEINFGCLRDWLPVDIQETLERIGKLTLRDGERLVSAKPLLDSLQRDYIATQGAQGGAGKPTVENSRIPVGKYDNLCIMWVNRPYIPKQTKDEFLYEYASELDKKTFDRILKNAYQRNLIDKVKGRYKPKT